jgi:hypothetical protein
MHVADRYCLHAARLEHRREPPHRRLVERYQHVATAVEALGYPKAQLARHQRHRLIHEDVILLKAVLKRHFDAVSETLGDNERSLGALALDNRAGGKRSAVN